MNVVVIVAVLRVVRADGHGHGGRGRGSRWQQLMRENRGENGIFMLVSQ
jgi:hypothetical protein